MCLCHCFLVLRKKWSRYAIPTGQTEIEAQRTLGQDLGPLGTLPCFVKDDDPSREEGRHSSSIHPSITAPFPHQSPDLSTSPAVWTLSQLSTEEKRAPFQVCSILEHFHRHFLFSSCAARQAKWILWVHFYRGEIWETGAQAADGVCSVYIFRWYI